MRGDEENQPTASATASPGTATTTMGRIVTLMRVNAVGNIADGNRENAGNSIRIYEEDGTRRLILQMGTDRIVLEGNCSLQDALDAALDQLIEKRTLALRVVEIEHRKKAGYIATYLGHAGPDRGPSTP